MGNNKVQKIGQYVDLVKMEDDVQSEFSLHHDFSASTVYTTCKMVQGIEEYTMKVYDPLKDQMVLKNILID